MGEGKKKCYQTYLDDLVAGELQCWDVHSITCHQVTIENAENRFMSNNEKIILLSFELENDRLKADSEIMV